MVHTTALLSWGLGLACLLGATETPPPSPAFLRTCQSRFGFVPLDEGFLNCLRFHLDLQPDSALVPLTDERIAPDLLQDSARWMETFFQDRANPYAQGHKPSKYFLGKKNQNSLLCYAWRDEDYDFQILESCSTVLLCVQPLRKPLKTTQGVGGEQVATLLDRLVHLEKLPHKRPTLQQFRLPISLTKGTIFANAERLSDLPPPAWTTQITGFLSERAVCLLLLKAAEGRAAMDLPPDEYWLKADLFAKDGKTRIYPCPPPPLPKHK